MIVRSAIIIDYTGPFAAFLVDRETIYPENAKAFLEKVRHIHPYLGKLLVSPGVQGMSYIWAQWDHRGTINTDEIEWFEQDASILPEKPLPF